MDPVATILLILTSDSIDEMLDATDHLKTWYAKGGFRPQLQDVLRLARAQRVRMNERRVKNICLLINA